ncbi:Pal1-domain-containing protein [Lentithecium fluviatile CBS 122367]|uniref:Pal1-domain-containing protein n=1 Tax=Lentithecium fluviatile CBS 122367 TaxID=1168545 RepID=A0A6G1ID50_9PLEO|nr:Pal1-domain-containing protein [Lentithecium fluviatile CBS 122367]
MIAEPSMPDRRPSPGLSLELSSNNPFRNRAASPALPSPALQTPTSSGSRPMSRNPFLQTFEAEFNKQAQLIDMSANMKESPKKATFGNSAEELFLYLHLTVSCTETRQRGRKLLTMERFRQFYGAFANYPALRQNNLTLDDGDKQRPQQRGPPPRSGTLPHSGHRPSRSDEEERQRRARGPQSRGPPRPQGGSRPPPPRGSPDRRERRPRRNSESSMIDKGSLDPNEERRRRERRREREERARDGKSRSRRVRKPHGLDVIDKLDVSGIYGPSMIHHDGPYDAVQPHRNRKKDHRAPMEAFPLNSANNALGGSGPVNDKIDLDKIHGRGAEGFTDFGGAQSQWKKRPDLEAKALTYGPKEPDVIVHGDESYGLGTSTFLEGAPASRTAIEQRESENQKAMAEGGLGRKKSIAQRIRGISQPRREFEGRPRITSPQARYGNAQSPNGPLTTGGSYASNKANETNPFFDDYDEAYEKKGAAIKVTEPDNKDGVTSPSSPGGRNPLTRAMTADSIGSPKDSKPPGGGFLNRVKSLKGGRRPRPERPT